MYSTTVRIFLGVSPCRPVHGVDYSLLVIGDDDLLQNEVTDYDKETE
jgi:hypothetical protein